MELSVNIYFGLVAAGGASRHPHHFSLPLLLPPCGKERAGVRRPMFTSTNPSPQPSPRLDGERELFPFGACVKMRPAAYFESWNQTISSVAPSCAGNN